MIPGLPLNHYQVLPALPAPDSLSTGYYQRLARKSDSEPSIEIDQGAYLVIEVSLNPGEYILQLARFFVNVLSFSIFLLLVYVFFVIVIHFPGLTAKSYVSTAQQLLPGFSQVFQALTPIVYDILHIVFFIPTYSADIIDQI